MRVLRESVVMTHRTESAQRRQESVRRASMEEIKPVKVPFDSHFKLSKSQSPKLEKEWNKMSKV